MIKRFVKSPVPFLLILFCAVCAAAQSPANCALTDAPPLLGLRPGMSPSQVQGAFGKDLKIKVKTTGERTFFQNYVNKKATGKLIGVRALYLRFLDGKLYQIEIFYDEQPNAPDLETFAADLAAQLNFPPGAAWEFSYNKAVIDCGAFTLVADMPVDARVELTDTALRAEAAARREKGN
ncbi:MAG TPA: hypothetical protein VIL74_18530 [Pyrinomonadaceae bacterium]|jgi:hypothetical protein